MTSTGSEQRAHRSYDDAPAHVVEFYRENHREQTFEVASAKAAHFKALALREMSAWDALLELDELVDESDPDTELGQLDHALQAAEAARKRFAALELKYRTDMVPQPQPSLANPPAAD